MPPLLDLKQNARPSDEGRGLAACAIHSVYAFPFYYFSRFGRLPHAGWEGDA
jgi:hypothetical protein